MCYPLEFSLFLLANPNVIEKCSLTEHVENELFKAINQAINKKLGSKTHWKKRLGLVTLDEEGNDETIFAPLDWPTRIGGEEIAYFQLWENECDINDYWLSHAIGLNNGKLCFEFRAKPKPSGPSVYRIKKSLEDFYSENTCLKEDGFIQRPNGIIYLPFNLDIRLITNEFPDFKESITPVNTMFDKLAKHLPLFDKFVKELYQSNKSF